MIEIKRKCSSSVRNDPVKHQITFGDFTLRISEADYDRFDLLMQEFDLQPIDALGEILYAALEVYEDHKKEADE